MDPHNGVKAGVFKMSITKIERLRKEMDTAISTEDFQLAFQVVNDMLDIDPENAQFWNSKGVILTKFERIEEALESFDRGLLIDPNEPRIWYSKGCVLMDSGEFRLALACFYKSLDLDPRYAKARERFIKCLDEWLESGATTGAEPPFGQKDDQNSYEEVVEEAGMEWTEEKRILIEEEESMDEPHSVTRSQEIIKERQMKGTFLDDDLFRDEEEEVKDETWGEVKEENEEEEWSEEELEGWDSQDDEDLGDENGEGDDGEKDDDESEKRDAGEEWSEEELEGWDSQEDEDLEDEIKEEKPTVRKTIVCKCGDDIPIYSDDRPYRFECSSCGRTGTLKK